MGITGGFRIHPYLLIEQDPGADYELEDVLQSLHSFEELVGDTTFLSVIHVRFQNFSQFSG